MPPMYSTEFSRLRYPDLIWTVDRSNLTAPVQRYFRLCLALFSAILSLFSLPIVFLIVKIYQDLEVLRSILDQMKSHWQKKKRKEEEKKRRQCPGLGVAIRSRVLVLVFANWNHYKKNLFGFSSQRMRGFGPGREPTSCVLVSFVLVTIWWCRKTHYNNKRRLC